VNTVVHFNEFEGGGKEGIERLIYILILSLMRRSEGNIGHITVTPSINFFFSFWFFFLSK